MSNWTIKGGVAKINKLKNVYMIDLVENKFDNINNKKIYSIWFNVICHFKPNIEVGDTVLAMGTFEPSMNKNFKYAMKVNHIGVINSSNEDRE